MSIPIFGQLILKSSNPDTEAQIYQLKRGDNFVGRSSPSTPPEVNVALPITDHSVSRCHCKITISFGINGWEHRLTHLVTDERSSTILEDDFNRRIHVFVGDDIFLADNYRIIIGATELHFRLITPDEPSKYHRES